MANLYIGGVIYALALNDMGNSTIGVLTEN